MNTGMATIAIVGILVAIDPSPADSESEFTSLDARTAVREGNHRLQEGEPDRALAAYDHADQLQPEAREIALVQGLAHYDLKEYDQARAAFERARGLRDDALAADALYSLAATDHAEALGQTDDPKLAMSLLESGMRRYHQVLDEQPTHRLAREANFKAASMWRQLKQLIEQQPQEQQDCDKDNQDQDEEKEGDKEKQQSKSDEDGNEEQQADQQENSDEQQDQQNQADESSEQDKQQEQEQSAARKKDEVSREQAQRQLREMIQALRQRKKARRETVTRIPVAPVDKDW